MANPPSEADRDDGIHYLWPNVARALARPLNGPYLPGAGRVLVLAVFEDARSRDRVLAVATGDQRRGTIHGQVGNLGRELVIVIEDLVELDDLPRMGGHEA